MARVVCKHSVRREGGWVVWARLKHSLVCKTAINDTCHVPLLVMPGLQALLAHQNVVNCRMFVCLMVENQNGFFNNTNATNIECQTDTVSVLLWCPTFVMCSDYASSKYAELRSQFSESCRSSVHVPACIC